MSKVLPATNDIFFKKRSFFWDVVPCGLVEVYRHFGDAHCLHLQDALMMKAEASLKGR
jgi:hypothetical protein